MEKMLDEVKYCKGVMKKYFNTPLKMTDQDEEDFKKADKCRICDHKFKANDIRYISMISMITGKYCGSGHQSCNLNYQLTDKIPVIFHNLRGYDSHFIMQQIGQIYGRVSRSLFRE